MGTEKTGVFRPLAEDETAIAVGDFSGALPGPFPVPEPGVGARPLFAAAHWFIESAELGCGENWVALEFDPDDPG